MYVCMYFYFNSSAVNIISGIQYSDSTILYITQWSSQQVHSLLPFTYFTHLSAHLPSSNHQFVLYIEVVMIF